MPTETDRIREISDEVAMVVRVKPWPWRPTVSVLIPSPESRVVKGSSKWNRTTQVTSLLNKLLVKVDDWCVGAKQR